jgi:hypothetical protein
MGKKIGEKMSIEQVRQDAQDYVKNGGQWQLRSCGDCNEAHSHLMTDDGPLFNCFSCGRWFYHGVDITTDNKPGYSHGPCPDEVMG